MQVNVTRLDELQRSNIKSRTLSLNLLLLSLSCSYSLSGGHGQFSINPATGQIITSSRLDREERANYQLLVVATDGGQPQGLSSSATVSVTVTDINDNPPRFHHHPYVTHIPASTAAGQYMPRVSINYCGQSKMSNIVQQQYQIVRIIVIAQYFVQYNIMLCQQNSSVQYSWPIWL